MYKCFTWNKSIGVINGMIELPKSKIRQEIKIIRNYCLRYTQKNPDAKFRVLSREEGVGVWRI